jgi:hypothetical protein
MSGQWAVAVTSASALAVSLFSLWKITLAPFKLKVAYNSPTFTIYKMTPEVSGGQKPWWIPSVDMSFTFYNTGKRPGEVTDIRLMGKLKTLDAERTFIFYAKWIVDFQKFQQNRGDRVALIESAIERDWYPLILAGNAQESLHILLEGWRWDKKFTGTLKLILQVFSSEKNVWVTYEEYQHLITEHMYDETSTYTLWNKRFEKTRGGLNQPWENLENSIDPGS